MMLEQHETPTRFVVNDWILQCFRDAGYHAFKLARFAKLKFFLSKKIDRMTFPRVKKGVFSWTYIIIPPGWVTTLGLCSCVKLVLFFF